MYTSFTQFYPTTVSKTNLQLHHYKKFPSIMAVIYISSPIFTSNYKNTTTHTRHREPDLPPVSII